MKVFMFPQVSVYGLQKCPGCGWLVYNLYTLADTQAEADGHHEDIALCGDCLCSVMSEGGHTITGSQID